MSKQMDKVYRPTSLAFINRPNPVEPQSVPQRHPLDGKSSQDIRHILHERTAIPPDERPNKRQKPNQHDPAPTSGDKSLDLPKLPVREPAKRLRIPPTLSGLHQPPPNAGLLPSISTEQPTKQVEVPKPPRSKSPPKTKAKAKRNKWTTEETNQLLKGVSRFGIGSWTKILNCPEFSFPNRTAIDLKDRFRVCCPDKVNDKRTSQENTAQRGDRKTSSQLQELGIHTPFKETSRRKRKGYSAAEDAALLKGFERHGNAWAAIRGDEELGLEGRKATDLRDRFRTRFPDKYKMAGLAPRPEGFPNQEKKGEGKKMEEAQEEGGKGTVAAKAVHVPASVPLFPTYDDVFFGAPGDDIEVGVGERITLDRGILDWPSDLRPDRLPAPSEMIKGGGIDPLATLMKLPRPSVQQVPSSNSVTRADHGTRTQPQSAQQMYSTTLPSISVSGSAALPSLAYVTGGVVPQEGSGQFELPSLVSFDTFEQDARTGGHFLGLDELLC